MPDSLVRLGLELAFAVARLGSSATPPVTPPRTLAPFLSFARLPDRALAVVRRAVDQDEEFRTRVATVAAVPEAADELDPPSTLFLTRPEGWVDELAALAEKTAAAAAQAREARDELRSARRAERAEASARRAAEVAGRARAETARLESALAEERRLRRAAEQEAASAGRVALVAEERAGALASEAAAGALREARLLTERDDLIRQVAEARAAVPAFPDPTPAVAAVAVARAATEAMARDVARALADASAALVVPGSPGSQPAAAEPRPAVAPTAEASPAGTQAGRQPLAIPPAVFDDSPAAAAHLVRAPGALLLVDGYNAAMAIWPGLDVTEIRLRLIDALAELSARTGVRVHVVFDGAEGFGAPSPASHRSGLVRVSFSEPEVEADDVILELVGTLPTSRPVLVASSDRRVQDGARRLGANIISSTQLATVLGR